MQIKEKAIKGVVWAAVGNWGNQITTLIVFILLTRLLDPEAFGLVAMASVFTSFVSLFVDQGLSEAVVQRDHLETEHLNTAFWSNIIISSGLTLLGIILSGTVADVYGEPQLRPIVVALSMTFVVTAFSSTQQALLKRSMNFRALTTRQLIASIVGGTAGIIMALKGAGAYALVGKTLITGLVGAVVLWQVSDWRPCFCFSRRHFYDLFTFGMSMVGVKMTNFLRTRLDDFLIGYFLGAEALGFYSVAYRLGRLTLDMFTGVMSNVAVTTFARLQNDVEHLQNALYKFSSMAGLITFPTFMGLIVLAPDLIVALSGAQWSSSVATMRMVSLAGFSLSLQYFLAYLIIALGKPHRLFVLNAIVTIATAIGFTIGARYGILYVALAYTIVNILFYGVYLTVVHHMLTLNLQRYLAESWRFLVPATMMGVAVYFLNIYLLSQPLNQYLRLIIGIGLGASLYAGMVSVLYRKAFIETRGLLLGFVPFLRRAVH